MKKVVYYELEGKRFPLVFTYAVSEFVEDKYGSFEKFAKALDKTKTCLDMFAIMNAQGCAYVKWKMQDMPIDEDICLEPLTRDELGMMLSPIANASIISAINSAFAKATHNEITGTDTGRKNGKSA